jgi:hypothetical protein
MKTTELNGALLDYWTARAEGVPADELEIRPVQRPDPRTPDTICMRKIGPLALMRIDYSTNGALCMDMVQRDKIEIDFTKEFDLWAALPLKSNLYGFGPTAMIAICRAVVRASFGDEVEDLP